MSTNIPPLPLSDIKDFPYTIQEWFRKVGQLLGIGGSLGFADDSNLTIAQRSFAQPSPQLPQDQGIIMQRSFAQPAPQLMQDQGVLMNQIFGG